MTCQHIRITKLYEKVTFKESDCPPSPLQKLYLFRSKYPQHTQGEAWQRLRSIWTMFSDTEHRTLNFGRSFPTWDVLWPYDARKTCLLSITDWRKLLQKKQFCSQKNYRSSRESLRKCITNVRKEKNQLWPLASLARPIFSPFLGYCVPQQQILTCAQHIIQILNKNIYHSFTNAWPFQCFSSYLISYKKMLWMLSFETSTCSWFVDTAFRNTEPISACYLPLRSSLNLLNFLPCIALVGLQDPGRGKKGRKCFSDFPTLCLR